MSLKDRFADFLSEIEQMQKNNETLTEGIQKLEKEQDEGWKKFNTDTHILVEKDKLESLLDRAGEVSASVSDVKYVADEASSDANNCLDLASYAGDEIDTLKDDIADLLKVKEEAEE